jgi:putative phosphoserine phosphatase / 1-acylglycerol-3-phosphate O-acyltransferase
MGAGSRTRRPGVADVLRTLLALSAIAPGLAVGLAVLAWTRDRRRAVNRTFQVWGDLGTRAAGIELAVAGAEHLESPRPAVFLLNHQSGVDPMLICALLRRDFVGIAKREIRRNPVLGPAFAFAGVVFVDRFDRAHAIRDLEPAVDALRRGLSIAVAPEGTRTRDGRLGPFKKGAFRLAAAASVPIVPIVIRNARDVLPAGAWIMTAGRVEVWVQPPIPTQGWAADDLDGHVEAVHRLYREALGE